VETWWGQLSLGAAAVILFVLVGRTFVTYVGKRVTEDRDQHAEEVRRLTESWEARLADQREAARSWEATAKSSQKTADELADQVGTLLPAVQTMVRLVEAIREEQLRR
jgi:outer membrane murein-binding lipoprotein Lpp